MTDFLGRELKVGDEICFVTPKGYGQIGGCLDIGTVMGFTPKMIKVRYMQKKRYRQREELVVCNRDSCDVIFHKEGKPVEEANAKNKEAAATEIPGIPTE